MSELLKPVIIGLVAVGAFAFFVSQADPGPSREYVAATVMMNSDFANGDGAPTAPCMVLWDMDASGPSVGQASTLQDIASEIFDLYTGDATSDGSPGMDQFVRHLENDTFRPHCRRKVPAGLARGRNLWVSDIMLVRRNFSPDPAQRRIGLVAVTGEETGTIKHLPWNESL